MSENERKLLFNDETVVTKLKTIKCVEDGESFKSEPYLTAIYFQIDGSSIDMSIDININTVNILKVLFGIDKVENLYGLGLNGKPKVFSPSMPNGKNEWENLNNWSPSQDGAEFKVPKSVGEYKSIVKPIPITFNSDNRIEVFLDDIIEEVVKIINDNIEYELDFNKILDTFFDKECRKEKIKINHFLITFLLNDIIGGFPSLVGVVYVLNEHDLLDDDIIRGIKSKLEKEVESLLQKIIDNMKDDLLSIQEEDSELDSKLSLDINGEICPVDSTDCSHISILQCILNNATKCIPLKIESEITDEYATFCQLWKRIDDAIDSDDTIGILTETRLVGLNKFWTFSNDGNLITKSEFTPIRFDSTTHTDINGDKDGEDHGTWELTGEFLIENITVP